MFVLLLAEPLWLFDPPNDSLCLGLGMFGRREGDEGDVILFVLGSFCSHVLFPGGDGSFSRTDLSRFIQTTISQPVSLWIDESLVDLVLYGPQID